MIIAEVAQAHDGSLGTAHAFIDAVARCGADVLSLDWRVNLKDARARLGDGFTLQGNLDPCVLFASKDKIKQETERILERFGHGPGHIFNLGHGILPTTQPENAKYLVSCVKELSIKYHETNVGQTSV